MEEQFRSSLAAAMDGQEQLQPKNLSQTCLIFYSKHFGNTGPLQSSSLCQSFSLMCLFFYPQCLHPAQSSLLWGPAKAFVLYKVVPKCGPQTSRTGTTMQILQTSQIRGASDLYFIKLSRRCSGMLTFENYCCQKKTLDSNPSPGFKFQFLKNTY